MANQTLDKKLKPLFILTLSIAFTFAVLGLALASDIFQGPYTPQEDNLLNDSANKGYLSSSNSSENKKINKVASKSKRKVTREESEKDLTDLQKQARFYRTQGLEAQKIGNLDLATSYYQKSIQLDPGYAVSYNDIGIIYEGSGMIDRAEASYLQAVKIDPEFLSAYSNLALLYENKRDLNKAAIFWAKRADLGDIDDPWTQRARQRLDDIRLVLGKKIVNQKELEIFNLTKDISAEKEVLKKDDKALAKYYLNRAELYLERGEDLAAYRKAIDAQQLDYTNKEIKKFIDKVQRRLLSR